MHIPDGYLAPVFSLGTGIITIPAWVRATSKVRSILNNRTVPLLAIFAALSFTIQMFNIPVPGGTTAHGVGGTLIAIVLGPWAAMLCVSVALIIQALFFGDGGVLAIFANCLNMGVILPFVGYYSYRLIAGRSTLRSTRRIWAAGIGSYLGITAAALAVGIELGVQPLLFSQNGHALYSPYTLVEALITVLGFAYIRRSHPEFLTSLRNIVTGAGVPESGPQRVQLWQIYAIVIPLALVLLFVIGLITGGDIWHLFGVDWSQVNWSDVGIMLLIVLLIAIVLIPLAWFLLPCRIKRVGTVFVALAIFVPFGLITPGFAFGEGAPDDVKNAFHYMPSGLEQLNGIWSAPFSEYTINANFFTDADAPLWHQALGYEITGIIGMLLLVLIICGFALLIRRISLRARPEMVSSDEMLF
jgi:cobalt/nickel transport system permease protein